MVRTGGGIVVMLVLAALGVGCGPSGSHATNQMLAVPGQYAPPAQLTPRLRTAVPDLAVSPAVGAAADVDLMAVGSDELFSLLDASGRFDLTERQRLRDLLSQQHLTDMLRPGQLAHPAPAVRGFDHLFIGQVNDLSIKKEPPPDKMSVAGVEQMIGIGGSYVPKLIVTAKVDLSLVDPRTGAVEVASRSDVHQVATPQVLGLQLTPEQLAAAEQVRLSPADTRRVLRFVLDEPLRPMLPRLDRWAAAQTPPAPDSLAQAAPPATRSTTQPTSAPAPSRAALIICPECGNRVAGDQEFCPNCGHKLR